MNNTKELTQEQERLKQAKKEYMKQWRKNNKDKVEQSMKRFYEKKANEMGI